MTVYIGIDPHKRSHSAVALDEHDEVLGQVRIDATARQVEQLLAFAQSWPARVWAIENANGLGRLLSRQLVVADQQVVDVPARLAARVRTLSGAGHKTDAHDAVSVAIAGRRARVLRPVVPDGAPELLGLLIERRWQVVSARQKTLVRIHEQLTKLLPGGFRASCRNIGSVDCCPPSSRRTRSRHDASRWCSSCSTSCASSTSSARRSTTSSTRPWPTTAPA